MVMELHKQSRKLARRNVKAKVCDIFFYVSSLFFVRDFQFLYIYVVDEISK